MCDRCMGHYVAPAAATGCYWLLLLQRERVLAATRSTTRCTTQS